MSTPVLPLSTKPIPFLRKSDQFCRLIVPTMARTTPKTIIIRRIKIIIAKMRIITLHDFFVAVTSAQPPMHRLG